MIWATGSGLFDPAQVGYPRCDRRFNCIYEIDDDGIFLTNLVIYGENQASYPAIGGVEPTIDTDLQFPYAVYSEIRFPVPFSGMLLIGRIESLCPPRFSLFDGRERPHNSRERPHNWREFRECQFIIGKLEHDVDHLAVFERMRWAVKRQIWKQEGTCRVILDGLTPDHWWEDFSWAYETVRDLESGSLLVKEKLHALKDYDRLLREQRWQRVEKQRERVEKQTAKITHIARRLFASIERGGWQCMHCGTYGAAHKDFRLSIGPKSCVICRKCGWVQAFKPRP
jgi:hypothetical protein